MRFNLRKYLIKALKNTVALIIVFIAFGCKSPKDKIEEQFSAVFTTAKDYHNLNGPVKEVRCYFMKNFKVVDTDKKPIMSSAFLRDSSVVYNAGNGMGLWKGYNSYDKNGMRTSRYPLEDSITEVVPDSVYSKYIYIYDKKQFNILKQISISKPIPYPVYNPYVVKPSRGLFKAVVILNDSSKLHLERIYKYDFDDENRVLNKKEYIAKKRRPINDVEDVDTRIENFYNAENKIIKQQYHFIESDSNTRKKLAKRLGYVMYTINLLEHDANFDYYEYNKDFEYNGIKDSLNYKNFRNEFMYDDRGNIEEFIFYVKNKPFKKETYTYNEEGILTSLERYVQADQTVGPFDNYYTKEFFDNYGNIIKSISAGNKDFTKPKVRLYEYEYDDYNNWIKCEMYLDGIKTETPTIVADRKFKYYE